MLTNVCKLEACHSLQLDCISCWLEPVMLQRQHDNCQKAEMVAITQQGFKHAGTKKGSNNCLSCPIALQNVVHAYN